jgi:hypothetical protein
MHDYLVKHGVILAKEQLQSGSSFATLRLASFRQIYGAEQGAAIYLIIRERVEREEDIINRRIVVQPLNVWPGHLPAFSPATPTFSPLTPSSVGSSSSSGSAASTMSEFSLSDGLPVDVPSFLDRQFIQQHPPILWQLHHLHYFLETFGIPKGYLEKLKIDVDSFIFMSETDYELLFPQLGKKIYNALRNKFVDPTIRYIKPAQYC